MFKGLFLFLKKIYFDYFQLCSDECVSACACRSSQRTEALDALGLELQTVVSTSCGCWGLNPDPLEEKQALLAAQPSPQMTVVYFRLIFSLFF